LRNGRVLRVAGFDRGLPRHRAEHPHAGEKAVAVCATRDERAAATTAANLDATVLKTAAYLKR